MLARRSALSLVTSPKPADEIALPIEELRSALSLVSHAKRGGFDTCSTFDLKWSPPASAEDAASWCVTTTDGHRLARFTSERNGWFRAPHAHAVALPGWTFDWIKQTQASLDVRIRIDGDGPIVTLPGHGTFRPDGSTHPGIEHLLGGLHTRSKSDRSHVRLTTEVRALFREIDAAKRDHADGSMFVSELDAEGWNASFVDGADRGVALNPSYFVDAMKSLVRVARDFDGPSIDARWAHKMEAVMFTAPHLLSVIMPIHA